MSALSMRLVTQNVTDSSTGVDSTPALCPYEQTREQRIRENIQRMQSLGIFDLSLKLKGHGGAGQKRKNRSHSGPKSNQNSFLVTSPAPVRRSSRLQNVTPVSYSEAVEVKKGERLKDEVVKLEEGAKPEVYTEEHEKLLGNTERSWTLFVDGYDKDGKRIYDPVRGKTCHQCRQKTLGYRTQCSQCNMVQGQFCGDCLYMRYGEHVLEALENENWICPVCRGICNCSLCRNSRGWAPTGPIYRKISRLGFKSVAHYLIQTRRAQKESEEEPSQASAKRSLSFPATEAPLKEPPHESDNLSGTAELIPDEKSENIQGEAEKNPKLAKRALTFLETKRTVTEGSDENKEARGAANLVAEKLESMDEKNNNSLSKHRGKRRPSIEQNPDSIGARLRRRRCNNSGC